jgi:hypothetical protein
VNRFFICAALLAICVTLRGGPVYAQTTTAVNPDTTFVTEEFPLWAKDLRRAEIVALGSFPFSMFFTTFAMDTVRYFDHEKDLRYAPWPFKAAGAINMNRNELKTTLAIALSVSAAIALADFTIVKVKRYQAEQRARQLPDGTPIIINTRSIDEKDASDAGDTDPPDAAPELP